MRDGRPVAAIVPFGGEPSPPLHEDQIEELFAALGKSATDRSAVAELLSDRR